MTAPHRFVRFVHHLGDTLNDSVDTYTTGLRHMTSIVSPSLLAARRTIGRLLIARKTPHIADDLR
ncbi:hypothetical protein BAUCODRAFT_125693 [Baudoinia panamericana UAMH 10762]|uniref:Uncharacterized protein n=1 Tax=Baudoinia panamericana (strain UAMH 10762) TaxID=717646 RepID=M2LFA5_BAUPA|nr:uncharacterized protein BAUCODRAFT_125693 [Baudoinia panamericana UAMH 10762]EMC92717.1 hypothetical protein BAUCODRAFT_125693 [Baudoinia panamericana UAMH 10762]